MTGAGMRVARALALATVLAALVLPAAPAVAHAPERTGWWWRAQSGLLVEVPPPPQVPEGGLYVEGAPDGPSAVSALRFRLPEGSVGVALVLAVAQEQGGEGAILLACPAAGPWIAAHAGAWESRPDGACDDQGVQGLRSEDGTTWTFPLALSSFTGARDLVLMPGADESRPAGLDGSVFSIAFEPPGEGTLVAEDTRAPEAQPPPRPPVFTPPADVGPAPPPLDPRPVAPADPPAPDTAAGDDPSAIAPMVTPPVPPIVQEEPAGSSGGRDARALATLIALLSVGIAGVLSRDRLVAVPGMPVKPDAEAREGGIGRFRRPRSSAPPPL